MVKRPGCGGIAATTCFHALFSVVVHAGMVFFHCHTEAYGCNGGDTAYVFKEYLKDAGAWTEADYPDTAAAKGLTSPCPAPAKQPQV